MNQINRHQWVRALTAHPVANINHLAERLTENWSLHHVKLPQTGLSLLTLEDGVWHQPYYLGEVPLSVAHIELENGQGETFAGAAQYMGDSSELAVALAICDAVMANQLPGWEEVATLIETGWEKRNHQSQQRGKMLAQTQVDFTLLAQGESDVED